MKIVKINTYLTPDGNIIFYKVNNKNMAKKETGELHTLVARVMFVDSRFRLDIHETAAVLSTRVKETHETDWQKLVIMIKFLIISPQRDRKSVVW